MGLLRLNPGCKIICNCIAGVKAKAIRFATDEPIYDTECPKCAYTTTFDGSVCKHCRTDKVRIYVGGTSILPITGFTPVCEPPFFPGQSNSYGCDLTGDGSDGSVGLVIPVCDEPILECSDGIGGCISGEAFCDYDLPLPDEGVTIRLETEDPECYAECTLDFSGACWWKHNIARIQVPRFSGVTQTCDDVTVDYEANYRVEILGEFGGDYEIPTNSFYSWSCTKVIGAGKINTTVDYVRLVPPGGDYMSEWHGIAGGDVTFYLSYRSGFGPQATPNIRDRVAYVRACVTNWSWEFERTDIVSGSPVVTNDSGSSHPIGAFGLRPTNGGAGIDTDDIGNCVTIYEAVLNPNSTTGPPLDCRTGVNATTLRWYWVAADDRPYIASGSPIDSRWVFTPWSEIPAGAINGLGGIDTACEQPTNAPTFNLFDYIADLPTSLGRSS